MNLAFVAIRQQPRSVLTKTFSKAACAVILAMVISLGLAHPASAGDIIEMKQAEYDKTAAMLRHWLTLVDKGKFAESFAATSESFRHDSTAEKWAAFYPKMVAETGPVISRGKLSLTTSEKPSHEQAPSTYLADFKTKFKKKSGTEHLEIVKENGEWKIANYLIIPD